MNCYGITDKGNSRKQNQDSYLIVRQGGMLLVAVCDGIGGAKAGDVASSTATAALKSYFKEHQPESKANLSAWLRLAVDYANTEVYRKGATNEKYHGMGTTLVAAICRDNEAVIANVGDSRAYLMGHDEQLKQLTQDHTLINDLINRGTWDEERLRNSGLTHVITRAIGIAPQVTSDIFETEADWQGLLLCSDGLYNSVTNELIAETVFSRLDLIIQGQLLVKQANDNGGPDNITLIIVRKDEQ